MVDGVLINERRITGITSVLGVNPAHHNLGSFSAHPFPWRNVSLCVIVYLVESWDVCSRDLCNGPEHFLPLGRSVVFVRVNDFMDAVLTIDCEERVKYICH